MAVISNRNSVNDMIGTSFDDYADTVARQRAEALITDACDWNAINCKPRRTYADDLTAMRGWVIEADNVRHTYASLAG